MKHEKDQTEDRMFQYLTQRLEVERQAGIPSVPESLLPEHIEKLLKEKKPKGIRLSGRNRSAWLVQGGAALTAAAVFLICLLPAGQGGSDSGQNQSAGGPGMKAETMAASYEECGVMLTENEIEGAMDMADKAEDVPRSGFRRSKKAARPDNFRPREYKNKKN